MRTPRVKLWVTMVAVAVLAVACAALVLAWRSWNAGLIQIPPVGEAADPLTGRRVDDPAET